MFNFDQTTQPARRRRQQQQQRAQHFISAVSFARWDRQRHLGHGRERHSGTPPATDSNFQRTGIEDVQLVDDALVAAAEDDHQVLDGDRPVPVPGPRTRTGRIGNPFPLQYGSRHLCNRSMESARIRRIMLVT